MLSRASSCAGVWEEYFTSRKAVMDNYRWPNLLPLYAPGCKLEPNVPNRYVDCQFGMNVQLLFRPSKVDEDSICSSRGNRPAEDGSASPSRIAVTYGQTLKSPTVYALYQTMSHWEGLGRVHHDIVLPIVSNDIYSWINVSESDPEYKIGVRQYGGLIDFNDFAYKTVSNLSSPLVLAPKYRRQRKCDALLHNFSRLRAVALFQNGSSKVQAVDPEWASRGHEYHQAYDPPILIDAVEESLVQFSPTVRPKPIPTQDLQPGAGLTAALPTKTAGAQAPTDRQQN